MDRLFKFSIVGGGLTATSMLCQFVEKASIVVGAGKLDPSVISLSIFEKTDEFGSGFLHNQKYLLPFHEPSISRTGPGPVGDLRLRGAPKYSDPLVQLLSMLTLMFYRSTY